jgi:thiol-disulfide isomerase/thioredoxin
MGYSQKQISLIVFILISGWLRANPQTSVSVITDKLVDKRVELRYFSEVITKRAAISEYDIKGIVKDNTIRFNLPRADSYRYISISCFDYLSPFFASIFLIYPGDNIIIKGSKDGWNISGKGSERMKCQLEIFKNGFALFSPVDSVWKFKNVSRFHLEERKFDSCATLREKIISFYALEEKQKVQVSQESSIEAWYRRMSIFKDQLIKPSPGVNDEFKAYYSSKWLNDQSLIDNRVQTCRSADLLFQKTLSDMIAKGYKVNPRSLKFSFVDVIKNIDTVFKKSRIKEQVQTLCVNELYTGTIESDSIVRKLMMGFSSPALKKIMEKTLERFAVNTTAYNFTLPDINGQHITLQQFSGRVTIIDFWFVGCSSCITMNESMKAVVDRFKDDNRVVFLNINTDKEIQNWKKGLATGKYHHPTDILLYTEGKGLDHPLLRYYNFHGFPSMLVIDRQGKLISSKTPDRNDPEGFKKFTKQIESLLN